ncbi:MAG: ABC transporter ATP-binding protein [Treponema sp.]|nr:ABC transporter ATP-binding protein [Treponema sp.]
MIGLSHIEVRFGDFLALRDINLNIEEGEFFTFLGPSGCGKTTTLRTITGFVKPSGGRVSIKGRDITHAPVEKRNIGMVFQSYALFPTMSVYENIAFGLRVKKVPKHEITLRVEEMAIKVDLDAQMLKRKVSQLSGGQQQRVAIARALVTSPAIICLDEPLSNLDAKLRVQMRKELKDLQRKFGITTIYVTHDQEEALTLSDRIAVFNKGQIEQVGRPDDIYNRSATEFVSNFIGDINPLGKDFLCKTGASKLPGVDERRNNYIRLERIHMYGGEEARNYKAREGELFCEAIVKGYEYYGTSIKYSLDALGQDLRVMEKNSGRTLFDTGSSVLLSFDAESIMQY